MAQPKLFSMVGILGLLMAVDLMAGTRPEVAISPLPSPVADLPKVSISVKSEIPVKYLVVNFNSENIKFLASSSKDHLTIDLGNYQALARLQGTQEIEIYAEDKNGIRSEVLKKQFQFKPTFKQSSIR